MSRRAVPLQGRCAQVWCEVGAGKEGDPLLEGWESESLSFLLACCPLERHIGDVHGYGPATAIPRHTDPRMPTYSGRASGRKSQGDVGQGR